jgi:hypothetical protein
MKDCQKRAEKKYLEKNDLLSIKVDRNVNKIFINYCKEMNSTKKSMIEKMILYYIDHN